MRKFFLLPVIMGLFDGGAAGGAGAGAAGAAAGGAAPAAAGNGTGAQGDTNTAARGDASHGKAGESRTVNVRYGKQADDAAAGEQGQQQAADAANSEEAIRAEFLQLVNGKFKNAYAAEMQKIIDKRFASAKQSEQQLEQTRPVMDLLMQRYNITDGNLQKLYESVINDDPTLAERAEDNGMSIEQQREVDRLERENRTLRMQEQERQKAARAQEITNRWLQEAATMRQGKYPNFDLQQEALNPEFLNLLRAGIPMEHAYEVLHRDEINRAIESETAASTEKRVVDNIRAQGMRPRENGTSSQGTFITKNDPRQLTREDHKAIRERVRRGERIVF